MSKGLIYVLTGDGKGKTTAAFGLAIRAAGHNKRVLIIQFIKDKSKPSGEIKYLSQITNHKSQITNFIEIHTMGLGFVEILGDKKSKKLHQQSAEAALSFLQKKIKKNNYDLVILDEINVAIDLELLDVNDIISFLKTKHEKLNIILTGRNAHKKLIALADMVSEIKNIKHPFDSGLPAQKGIDF